MSEGKMWNINLSLLPIKIHYFFFFGAMGAVMPFITLLAKSLGMSATAVGVVYTVLTFCMFISKPIFGFVTDYFKNLKLVVLILVSMTSVGYLSLSFMPPLHDPPWMNVQIQCGGQGNSLIINPNGHDGACLRDALKLSADGELSFRPCESNSTEHLFGKVTYYEPSAGGALDSINTTALLQFESRANFSCDCISRNSSTFRCAGIDSCLLADDVLPVYYTYKFWMFTFLVVVSGTAATAVFILSDAACYVVLGESPELFGKQRLWATISWGCATLLAGFLNDLSTGDSGVVNFHPAFFLMLALATIDILLLLNIQLPKTIFSMTIFRDIQKVFSSHEMIAFAIATYVMGALTGLSLNYEFWYLQDLGANQTLLGLCVAVQFLVAGVPCFFFAGWFKKKFGYFYCVILSFGASALRMGLYYLLEDPWMALFIDLLHGLTFSLFHASMTGYAAESATSGTQGTILGILTGLFDGLGVGMGSLLGGLGFDAIGGRLTFLVAGIVSVICVPILIIMHKILTRRRQKVEIQAYINEGSRLLPHLSDAANQSSRRSEISTDLL